VLTTGFLDRRKSVVTGELSFLENSTAPNFSDDRLRFLTNLNHSLCSDGCLRHNRVRERDGQIKDFQKQRRPRVRHLGDFLQKEERLGDRILGKFLELARHGTFLLLALCWRMAD